MIDAFHHAHLTHQEIMNAGRAVNPLDFPAPHIKLCTHDHNATIIDCQTGLLFANNPSSSSDAHNTRSVLYKLPSSGAQPEEGYLFEVELQKSRFGSVWRARLLKRVHQIYNLAWVTTNEYVAIKISSLSMMAQFQAQDSPLKEVACLQLVGDDHPNIISCREALKDSSHLYLILPFCHGGSLLATVAHTGRGQGLEEEEARYWFLQILQGLYGLQSKGICHRDLSLENIVLDNDKQDCLIIDFGMSLSVPYTGIQARRSRDIDCITDVSTGMIRRLIRPQGTCGKYLNMSPEIYANEEPFDGFAIDLWAAGAMLFIMLTGFPPWDTPQISDALFEVMVTGKMGEQLRAWDVELTSEALDLLQRMFRLKPNERLTLAEVMSHPWVTNADVHAPDR